MIEVNGPEKGSMPMDDFSSGISFQSNMMTNSKSCSSQAAGGIYSIDPLGSRGVMSLRMS